MLHPHVEAESASDYANHHVPLPPLCNRALQVYVGTAMPWTPTFSEILHHFGEELCTGHVVVSAKPVPKESVFDCRLATPQCSQDFVFRSKIQRRGQAGRWWRFDDESVKKAFRQRCCPEPGC